jgi:hypothetical protein
LVYFDSLVSCAQCERRFIQECKYADAASCRRIYERIAAQKLSSKQMHAVLKRWLAFEQTHGTPADAQAVRERARAYVASIAAADGDE